MSFDAQESEFSTGKIIAWVVGICVVFAGVIALGAYLLSGSHPQPRQPEEIMVKLLPPPVPPPPPPPPTKLPPPPPLPKMVEQPPVKPNEVKPKEVAKTPDKPAGPPGPKASGPPSDDGLAGSGTGDGGIGGGDGGASRWGWYAAQVQARIADAVRQNSKTRTAGFKLKVRIWADASGRVIRVKLSGSTGDPAVDQALKDEILVGLQLPEAPPPDMPMPMVMIINDQRPG